MKVSVGKHLNFIEAEVWMPQAKFAAEQDANKNGGFCVFVFPADNPKAQSCGHLIALEQGGNKFRDKSGDTITAKRKWTNKELNTLCDEWLKKGDTDICPLCAHDISDHNLHNRWETNWIICGNPLCPLESQSFIVNIKNDKIVNVELPYYLYEKEV